jgi:3-oxoacyl-[acyl-carrier protein] reductase
VLWLAQATLPGMMERGWGRILSFTMAGPRAAPMVSAERVARAGLQVLMRDLAALGAPHGVTANCLKLGFVDSGSSVAPTHLPHIPAGRQGRVEEVVSAARLLLSDQGAYINGAEIPVSGGYGV